MVPFAVDGPMHHLLCLISQNGPLLPLAIAWVLSVCVPCSMPIVAVLEVVAVAASVVVVVVAAAVAVAVDVAAAAAAVVVVVVVVACMHNADVDIVAVERAAAAA